MKNHNHHITTILFLISILLISLFISGCSADTTSASNYEPVEQPHLYWKDIDVTITDIEKKHWFAGTHWYQVTTYVHSDEYNLDGEYTEKGSGIFGCPASWDYETGDTVKAELYSWILDSTGEVTRREINQVY